jgi:FkbM family methyltransferase
MKVIVDVGADGYPAGNPASKKATEDTQIYLFECLPAHYDKLVKKYGKKSNFHLSPLALSNEKGTAVFYDTRKHNCSSLREPNEKDVIVRKRQDLLNYTKIEVETDTLENVLGHLEEIDYLKLDTQGSEYEIIEGAGDLIYKVKEIRVEVEFSEWYKGQKLAKDVQTLLEGKGFFLTGKSKQPKNHADYYFRNEKYYDKP